LHSVQSMLGTGEIFLAKPENLRFHSLLNLMR
jgi:hypothetical protein